MTVMISSAGRAMRQRLEARRTRRSVTHLDVRLLRDAGLETFAPQRLGRPFWWLWRGARPDGE